MNQSLQGNQNLAKTLVTGLTANAKATRARVYTSISVSLVGHNVQSSDRWQEAGEKSLYWQSGGVLYAYGNVGDLMENFDNKPTDPKTRGWVGL